MHLQVSGAVSAFTFTLVLAMNLICTDMQGMLTFG